ncbi:MAG TPA: PilC/PilY family type IV pilus protein [Steroidobacteraceae bacterium]|jgi:type IV pilus assembly protein PilY1|nr:PilC/PilY family type IV pilus protein [Steroidobacteraceae bacterium]
MNIKSYAAAWAVALTGLIPAAAWAQVTVVDDFTQGQAAVSWVPFNGACLTAGTGGGSIPACVGLPYYTEALVGGATGALPDPVGSGALRFTNGSPGGYHQNGAIVLNPANAFPSNAGVQITFTTVTYRGNSGGAGGDGADGISFFLMDAAYPPDIGAFGGSLGYTCSNVNYDPTLRADGTPRAYDGLVGAYLGLGIDEYGNFLNGSNPFTGYNGDNAINTTGTAGGFGYQPGRIGMRGAGSVGWHSLNNRYPVQYPTSLTPAQRASSVQKTCNTGVLWDYSVDPNNPVVSALQPPANQPIDYPAIPNAFSLTAVQIANEAAITRSDGTPISYKLKITSGGLLSLSYSINSGAYQPVISGQNITASNGPLPANFLFGFAGSTGGSTNIHEIMCFRAAPVNQSASSAGGNQQQAAKIQAGSQVYFAYYNPDNWTGSLTSQNLLQDAQGNITGYSVPNWDASCVLTGTGGGQGATCPSTGAASVAPEAPNVRTILSWNGSQGIAFRFPNLTAGPAGQQATLDQGDLPLPYNANRLNFLRGDRSNEQNILGVGLYRARTSVLGDIVDSSPAWVGPASSPYGIIFTDKIGTSPGFPENAGQSYAAFKTAGAQTRTNVVYAGANDGLLHGFRTGSYSAANVYQPALNDGYELLAYMPGAIVNTIHSTTAGLDFSNPQYGHNFYVDATPGTGDLFYQGTWHTWLVGGLGAGGAAIYALDITQPANFTEANAATLVMGEWTNQTLVCVNVGGCAANLGNTYGVPQIRRFHNGKWGAVFGNGIGSASGAAGIFVMIVDPVSAAETFYYIGTSAAAGGNGIAFVTAADLDSDNIADYVYAGDLQGNLWRFDLTNANPALWAASASPLFTTPGGQPITTQVIVASVPANTGPPRIMIDFGTGQVTPFTNTNAATYASGAQALYGIWDWNLGGATGWNTKGSVQYASLPTPQTIVASGPSLNLQTQSITTTGIYRSVSNTPVCFKGSTGCLGGAPANTQFGWILPLSVVPGTPPNPAVSEQVVFNPILELGIFIVNTTIPPTNSPTTCSSTTPTGFTMAINPTTGGSFPASVFADSTGSFNNLNISGVEWNGTGSGEVVTSGGNGTVGSKVYYVTQTSSTGSSSSGVGNGNGTSTQPLPPQQMNVSGGTQGGRLTWVQRR